mgnify:CR=1 FL=1
MWYTTNLYESSLLMASFQNYYIAKKKQMFYYCGKRGGVLWDTGIFCIVI